MLFLTLVFFVGFAVFAVSSPSLALCLGGFSGDRVVGPVLEETVLFALARQLAALLSQVLACGFSGRKKVETYANLESSLFLGCPRGSDPSPSHVGLRLFLLSVCIHELRLLERALSPGLRSHSLPDQPCFPFLSGKLTCSCKGLQNIRGAVFHRFTMSASWDPGVLQRRHKPALGFPSSPPCRRGQVPGPPGHPTSPDPVPPAVRGGLVLWAEQARCLTG